MRIPVVPQISTKDGVSAKNARLTNCLKESKSGGDKAVIRPGLVLDAVASGVGNGLVVFDNQLVSVYGATLGFGVIPGVDGWTLVPDVVNSAGGSSICFGNGLFYIVDAGGYFFTTTNLTDVVERTATGYVSVMTGNSLAAGSGLVCFITGTSDGGNGADVLWSDDDGDTWNFEPDAINGLVDSSITNATLFFTGTRFYASVADQSDDMTTWSSSDRVTWNQEAAIIGDAVFPTSFASGLGYLYAITNFGCAYSTDDGESWTAHPTLNASRDVANMVLSNSTLVAFGDIGGTPYLYRSTDGITFSETSMASVVGAGGSPSILSITSDALVLTIYQVDYYTSTDDGASWTANVDSSGAIWQRNAYGGGYTISLEQSTTSASVLGAPTNGSIPALTTITGSNYDFAQSTT